MGQLLVMIMIPPLVGVVTYAVLRFVWNRQERAASIVHQRERDA